MRLVKPSFEILSIMHKDGIFGTPLELIEKAGRTCYKSEDKLTKDSAIEFVKKINHLGHKSVLEHSAMTVRFVCDRGVSHELVRHRLCAFSQESTRYCNYKGGVTFVIPPWLDDKKADREEYYLWSMSMKLAEDNYIKLLSLGWSPQQARSVLPNSLKTEVVVTTNFREWKHIFKLRTSNAAHPQMRELMLPLLEECKQIIPVIFDSI